jgi:hypothetical protein
VWWLWRARKEVKRARAENAELRGEVSELRGRVDDLAEAFLRKRGIPLDLAAGDTLPERSGNLVPIEATRAARRRRWRALPGAAILAAAGRALFGHPLRSAGTLALAAMSASAIALLPTVTVAPHNAVPGHSPSPAAVARAKAHHRRRVQPPAARAAVQPGSQRTAPIAGQQSPAPAPSASPSPGGLLKKITGKVLPSPSPSQTCVTLAGVRTCLPLDPLGAAA